MTGAPKLVTIFGGSGFIGRYIAQQLAHQGWRVRVAVRRPNEALFVRTFGTVGQVTPVLANIRDDASTSAAIKGADVVINCVGLLQQYGKQRFDALHVEGAGRIARIAAEQGVANLVHLSSIGASQNAKSEYFRTKAEGEAQVLAAFPSAVILRPSVVFGPEDKFFNRLAEWSKLTLIVPLVGANTRFQPVYVNDVATVAARVADGQVKAGVYELGGPEIATFRDLTQRLLAVIRRKRLVIGWPFWIARINAWFLDMAQSASLGLFKNTILTGDQVQQLRHDNIVGQTVGTFSDLGISPTPMDAVLESYLYCHRPSGQYQAIKESAANL